MRKYPADPVTGTGNVACSHCAHFYVTWDAAFPSGCRAMGFKCRGLPVEAVRRASGEDCRWFLPREGRTRK